MAVLPKQSIFPYGFKFAAYFCNAQKYNSASPKCFRFPTTDLSKKVKIILKALIIN